MAQTVKNLPALWETWVRSLGGEDPLEKETATHSSVLAWRIPWQRTWWAKIHGVAKGQTRLSDFTSLHWAVGGAVSQDTTHLIFISGRQNDSGPWDFSF